MGFPFGAMQRIALHETLLLGDTWKSIVKQNSQASKCTTELRRRKRKSQEPKMKSKLKTRVSPAA
jgi:hypothetical protein